MKKTFKKLIAPLALASVLALPTSVFAFSDVDKEHWASADIAWADSAEIVKGYPDETFKPEGNITRAEFFRMVNVFADFEDEKDVSFTDVKADDWFYKEVKKAVAAGYLTDAKTELKPNEAISREEVADILSQIYKLEDKENEAAKFSDKDAIIDKGAVGALVEKKIIAGYPDGLFKPAGEIKRSEAARMLHTTVKTLGKTDLYFGKYKDDLIILHTNDVHGSVNADDKHIGYANYKNVIDKLKKDNKKVMVIDAGDASQGSNFASLNEGADVITVLNMLGLDAFAPGNHEFDYSKESALENHKNSKFTWYASNLTDEKTGETIFSKGEVLDVDGLKVGVFGLATPETKYKADPRNTEGIAIAKTVDENTKIAQEEVDRLKKDGAEVIVMVAHLGTDEASDVTSDKVAQKVNGINVIIDGHSHTLYKDGHKAGNSFIASTGDTLQNIGLTTINKDGEVKSRMISKSEALGYGENEDIKNIIDDLSKKQEEVLGEVLGKTATNLDGERAQVRTGETNLGNLITDAMRKESKADVVITNGGGIRASIKAGDVTVGDVFTVLPFGNAMTVIEVTGQDIVDALNHGVKDYPNAAGQFSHVSGLTFDLVKGSPSKATNVKVDGKPIDLAKTYTLATNDFMAVGGDGYDMFKGKNQKALYGSLAKIVEEYVRELTKENPNGFEYKKDNRINVVGEAKNAA